MMYHFLSVIMPGQSDLMVNDQKRVAASRFITSLDAALQQNNQLLCRAATPAEAGTQATRIDGYCMNWLLVVTA